MADVPEELKRIAGYLFDQSAIVCWRLERALSTRCETLEALELARVEAAHCEGALEELKSAISIVASVYGVRAVVEAHKQWEHERDAGCPF